MTTTRFEFHVESPIGRLRLVSSDDALIALYTHGHRGGPRIEAAPGEGHPVLSAARRQLIEYFAGARTAFALPLCTGGTDFQRAVWAGLLEIPFGATWSYTALARRVRRTTSARAVGAANAANPISIIIPCHRVVGADGSLTGYAGGLAAKQWLLEHEARIWTSLGGSAGLSGRAAEV
jgi:methylated-DNA-[protein]-cysteine S-methyltransferase